MSTTIPQRELRNDNTGIIARVMAGESFVVTRDGVPVADVVPHVASARPPQVRRTADLGEFLASADVDAASWLRDIRAADDDFDDERDEDPWSRRRG